MATQTFVNSVTLTDATEFNRYDSCAYCYLTGAAGTNTITATGPANMTLAAPQVPFILVPAVTNTGATTLAITPSGGSVLTAKNIFHRGLACTGGELVAGVPTLLVYDGTQYQILGNSPYSDTYTPTISAPVNVGSSSASPAQYSRVGNYVHVSGRLEIDATAVSFVYLELSLPIASNFTQGYQAAGVCSQTTFGYAGVIGSEATNNTAYVTFIPIDANTQGVFYEFGYLVL